jgi:arginyl-tRNA synthetase
MLKTISELLQKALKKEKIKLSEQEIENFIEVPPSIEMGDFAFPCFFLIPKFKLSPEEIALKLRQNIGNQKEFEDIQTSGPYINFFINKKTMALNLINKVLKQKDKYGSFDIGKNTKVLIEHTSINPNASPHVGRARNAIIGDSIVRIFKFLNFNTEVHYLVNNVSKQIAMLVLAKAENLKFKTMLKKYVEISNKVKKSKKLEKKVFDLLYKFEQGDKEVTKKFNKVTSICLKGQIKILSDLNIKYDFFDYESTYINKSKLILEDLQKTGKLFKDENDRLVLDLKGTSVENKMKSPVLVLTRNDGTGLYPLRDIAYTIDKMKKAEKNLIVLGEDQKLYFEQLKETLKLLAFRAPEVIHYSFILLKEKNKLKKMSTRKGEVVLLEDFLKQAINNAKKEIKKRCTKGDSKKVGIGAVKYAILKNNPNRIINFNLKEALNFEGDTGPYIQYSYARASSILRKINKKSKKFAINDLHKIEIELIKKLSQFKEVFLKAYETLNPSLIAHYSYELAQIFNEFYHSCPVIQEKETQDFRIKLIQVFRQVLKNSLSLLGIETLEEM